MSDRVNEQLATIPFEVKYLTLDNTAFYQIPWGKVRPSEKAQVSVADMDDFTKGLLKICACVYGSFYASTWLSRKSPRGGAEASAAIISEMYRYGKILLSNRLQTCLENAKIDIDARVLSPFKFRQITINALTYIADKTKSNFTFVGNLQNENLIAELLRMILSSALSTSVENGMTKTSEKSVYMMSGTYVMEYDSETLNPPSAEKLTKRYGLNDPHKLCEYVIHSFYRRAASDETVQNMISHRTRHMSYNISSRQENFEPVSNVNNISKVFCMTGHLISAAPSHVHRYQDIREGIVTFFDTWAPQLDDTQSVFIRGGLGTEPLSYDDILARLQPSDASAALMRKLLTLSNIKSGSVNQEATVRGQSTQTKNMTNNGASAVKSHETLNKLVRPARAFHNMQVFFKKTVDMGNVDQLSVISALTSYLPDLPAIADSLCSSNFKDATTMRQAAQMIVRLNLTGVSEPPAFIEVSPIEFDKTIFAVQNMSYHNQIASAYMAYLQSEQTEVQTIELIGVVTGHCKKMGLNSIQTIDDVVQIISTPPPSKPAIDLLQTIRQDLAKSVPMIHRCNATQADYLLQRLAAGTLFNTGNIRISQLMMALETIYDRIGSKSNTVMDGSESDNDIDAINQIISSYRIDSDEMIYPPIDIAYRAVTRLYRQLKDSLVSS